MDKVRMEQLLNEAKKKYGRKFPFEIPVKRIQRPIEVPYWLQKSQQRDA